MGEERVGSLALFWGSCWKNSQSGASARALLAKALGICGPRLGERHQEEATLVPSRRRSDVNRLELEAEALSSRGESLGGRVLKLEREKLTQTQEEKGIRESGLVVT